MENVKYEAVFGDQSLFDGAPEDAEYAGWFCQEVRWYMILNGKILFSDGGSWCTSDNPYLSADIAAMRRIIKTPAQHSDDVAVDLFAAKMKEKLEKSRDKGRSGWESCPIEHLIASLKDHISKGDPVDVANFAMMISQRGESIKTPVWTEKDKRAGRLPPIGSKYLAGGDRREFTCLFHSKGNGTVSVIGFNSDDEVSGYQIQYCHPIENPAEKAQREEDEFVKSEMKDTTLSIEWACIYERGVRAAYRKLKGGE